MWLLSILIQIKKDLLRLLQVLNGLRKVHVKCRVSILFRLQSWRKMYRKTSCCFIVEKITATYISQLSFDEFHKAEEVFTNELTKYTKKQFFEVFYNLMIITTSSTWLIYMSERRFIHI